MDFFYLAGSNLVMIGINFVDCTASNRYIYMYIILCYGIKKARFCALNKCQKQVLLSKCYHVRSRGKAKVCLKALSTHMTIKYIS